MTPQLIFILVLFVVIGVAFVISWSLPWVIELYRDEGFLYGTITIISAPLMLIIVTGIRVFNKLDDWRFKRKDSSKEQTQNS